MPRGNGTGPMGMGSKTGRAAGYCAGYDLPGYANPVGEGGYGGFGRGRGMGFGGRGRGWRNMFRLTGQTGWMRGFGVFPFGAGSYGNYPPSKEQEMDMLNQQEKELENTLESLKNRKKELSQDVISPI